MRTSLYTILCIVIRLGAVWLGLSALLSLPELIALSSNGDAGYSTWAAVGMMAIVLLISAGLWVYPGILAKIAAGKSAAQVFESPISADQMQQGAFAVLGMWFLMSAIVGLTRTVTATLLVAQMQSVAVTTALHSELASVLSKAVQIILGGALVLGSRGLVGWLDRVRYGGRRTESEDQ